MLHYYNIKVLKHKILKLKKFKKILKNESVIYALILSNKNENVIILIIFFKVTDYNNVFSKKNTRKLSEYKKDNYIINLNKQDSFFKLLYNLLSLKLKTL